jgi:hypothetical protein
MDYNVSAYYFENEIQIKLNILILILYSVNIGQNKVVLNLHNISAKHEHLKVNCCPPNHCVSKNW